MSAINFNGQVRGGLILQTDGKIESTQLSEVKLKFSSGYLYSHTSRRQGQRQSPQRKKINQKKIHEEVQQKQIPIDISSSPIKTIYSLKVTLSCQSVPLKESLLINIRSNVCLSGEIQYEKSIFQKAPKIYLMHINTAKQSLNDEGAVL